MFKTANYHYLAFVLMFFAETTYYLLILQTGIVEFYNSDISSLWMIPLGGVIGIVLTFKLQNYQHQVLSISFFSQILLISFYPNFSSLSLFLLGFFSGLVAPILIYQVKNLKTVFIVLSLSYVVGTFGIMTLAEERFPIAMSLSVLAFVSSLFISTLKKKEDKKMISIIDFMIIFAWLLLDSILFESLIRDDLSIWKNSEFVWIIAFSHLLGLVLAYKMHTYKYVNYLIIALFALSYLFFALGLQYPLAVIYPIIISFYNVIILKRFMQLPFFWLCFGAIGLWMSAGMGLSLALGGFYIVGWFVVLVLLLMQNKKVYDSLNKISESIIKNTRI